MIWVLGSVVSAFIWSAYDNQGKPSINEWGEIFNPETGTWKVPDPIEENGNLIDIDMPMGFGIDVNKWILAVPLIWITFKYKPWK